MNQSGFNCGGCGHGSQPVLVSYPYVRGASFQCDCCQQMYQPNTAKYPASGSMQENAFMVVNNIPYLVDNTTTKYGTKLSVSENVYTRISKRSDPSCINLTASLDMTGGDIVTNAVWNGFLNQVISNEFETLENYIPIQHSSVIFKLYFHLEDAQGGVVYENTVESIVKDHLFHYTDVNDFFITSFKNVIVTNLPQVDYNGIYTIFIDKMEAYVDILDTLTHVVDDLNPYYIWMNNNTHISVQHDAIDIADNRILIAAVNINQRFAVQLNLTTRLKMNFTAYMANTIATGNTFDVYNSLYHPTEHLIEELARDVTILTTAVSDLQARVAALENQIITMKPRVKEYAKNTEYTKGDLVYNEIGYVYQVSATYTSTDDESVTVDEAFEADVAIGKLVQLSSTQPIDETNEDGGE
jgi:hypothetical protein